MTWIQAAYVVAALFVSVFISSFIFKRKFSWLVCAAVFLLPVFLIAVIVKISPDFPVIAGAARILKEFIALPFILFLFKGKLHQKIFIFFSLTTIIDAFASLSTIIVTFVFSGAPGFPLLQYLLEFGMLILYFSLFLCFGRTLTAKLFTFDDKTNWIFYILGAALSWYCVWRSGSTLLIGISNLTVIFFAVYTAQKKINADYELSLAQEIISSGVDYYKRLDHILQEIRILRHDYRHQMGVIEELAKISRVKYIQEFLSTATGFYKETEPPVYCENLVISALLANYAERFAKEGISFSVNAMVPTEIPPVDRASKSLNNYELCIVLGNVLENALEGTMTVSADKRRVSLSVNMVDTKLLIEEKNTFDGIIVFNKKRLQYGEIPASRKGVEGGHGLRSIIAVCERHSGEYLPQWTENEYTVHILLNL
jgi:hypothetical protein